MNPLHNTIILLKIRNLIYANYLNNLVKSVAIYQKGSNAYRYVFFL